MHILGCLFHLGRHVDGCEAEGGGVADCVKKLVVHAAWSRTKAIGEVYAETQRRARLLAGNRCITYQIWVLIVASWVSVGRAAAAELAFSQLYIVQRLVIKQLNIQNPLALGHLHEGRSNNVYRKPNTVKTMSEVDKNNMNIIRWLNLSLYQYNIIRHIRTCYYT